MLQGDFNPMKIDRGTLFESGMFSTELLFDQIRSCGECEHKKNVEGEFQRVKRNGRPLSAH